MFAWHCTGGWPWDRLLAARAVNQICPLALRTLRFPSLLSLNHARARLFFMATICPFLELANREMCGPPAPVTAGSTSGSSPHKAALVSRSYSYFYSLVNKKM